MLQDLFELSLSDHCYLTLTLLSFIEEGRAEKATVYRAWVMLRDN